MTVTADAAPAPTDDVLNLRALVDSITDEAVELVGRRNIPLADAIQVVGIGFQMLMAMPIAIPTEAPEEVDPFTDTMGNLAAFPEAANFPMQEA